MNVFRFYFSIWLEITNAIGGNEKYDHLNQSNQSVAEKVFWGRQDNVVFRFQ